MERVGKLATPELAATVVVPESTPPPGFAPMAMVMLAEEPVTVLPSASSTVTCTAGEMPAPAVALEGWAVNANLVAGPGVMLNAVEVPPGSAPELALSV